MIHAYSNIIIIYVCDSNRLKKLKSIKQDSIVTGTAITEKLRERYYNCCDLILATMMIIIVIKFLMIMMVL